MMKGKQRRHEATHTLIPTGYPSILPHDEKQYRSKYELNLMGEQMNMQDGLHKLVTH